ncbi:hypothetical protein LVX13_26350 [Streptomyces albulus]|uniref:hypothetical protein n=1 Tax=Streptomyces noursei TaxID=1971 RepID=UPI001F30B000|nr:hypothetical protein [Streptomyces noursei]MCE4946617.1 hypothetical protein [Streptomyces noursei]
MDRCERGRGHHRDETRRQKTASFAHLDHPRARQALQVVRWRRDLGKGQLTNERIHLVTNLPPDAATGSRLPHHPRRDMTNPNARSLLGSG